MRRYVLLLTGMLALVSACGERPDAGQGQPQQTSTASTSTTGPVPDLAAGLAAWQQFPAGRRPRPIVLLDQLPQMAGFTTDAAKIAALDANYELAAALPPAPPTVTAQLPDGPAQLPALPADQAFAGLRTKRAQRPPGNPTDALPITRVELGASEWLTDRGRVSLPSWLFHPVDALGPITWPAVRPDAFWRFDEQLAPGGVGTATIGRDGTTLDVQLPAPMQPCPGEPVIRHEPVVVESATAVAVGVRSIVVSTAPGPPVTNCAHTLELRFEPHQVRLAAPLGGRVLVDEKGAPTAVTP